MINFAQYPVTIVIIAITVIISFMAFNNREMLQKMIFNPYAVKNYNEKWRFLTHGFIHGGTAHLLVNMYVFYNFGRSVEISFIHTFGTMTGEILYLALYLGAIVFAPLLAYKKHQDNPEYNSLGASGATSAILVAFIVMFPDTKLMLLFFPVPMPAVVFGILFFVYESYMNKRGGTGVAHDAHLLGAVFGLVFLALINMDYYRELIHYISNVL